jgi:3-hydroxybutyryl-CoA dehydrogenase
VDSNLTGTRVAVVGLGTTGAELTRALASAGVDVVGIAEGDDLAAAAGCPVVIEAVPEDLAAKRAVLTALASVCGPDTVAVTTALALPVAEVLAGTGWDGRYCGIRYVGPLAGAKLVELVGTEGDSVHRVTNLLTGLGKRTHLSTDVDSVGVSVALLFRVLNAAALMFDHGYADATDIDTAMRLGCGWPLGPLAMLDAIGLDTAVAVLTALAERTGRDAFVPAPVLRRLVAAGRLGAKTGAGCHTGNPTTSTPPADDAPIGRVGVLGSGTMATGIATALAAAEIPTILVARTAAKATAVAESAGGTVVGSDSIGDLADCDLVIEAVVEDLAVKRALLAAVDRVVPAGTVLATTTSSLPVVECATAVSRPDAVVGLHFFNPVPAMPLVELVRSELTGAAAARTARALCGRLGKHVVSCGDRAGFIVNRLLFPMLNDAVAAVGTGAADCDALDAVLRAGIGLPMGPIRLLDVIGADVALSVQESLCREYGAAELTPAPALRALVAAGYLGRKVRRSVRTHPVLRPTAA